MRSPASRLGRARAGFSTIAVPLPPDSVFHFPDSLFHFLGIRCSTSSGFRWPSSATAYAVVVGTGTADGTVRNWVLQENKVHARRRTIEPSLVQGLVSGRKCGYAFSRISTRSSARRIQYYRCSTSSGFRVPLPGFAVPLPRDSLFHFLRIPCSTSSGIPRSREARGRGRNAISGLVRPKCGLCTNCGHVVTRGLRRRQRLEAFRRPRRKVREWSRACRGLGRRCAGRLPRCWGSCYVAWEPGSGRRRSGRADGCGS